MSSNTHHELKRPQPVAKPRPRIPLSLQKHAVIHGFTSEVGGWGWEKSAQFYGLWKCRALRPLRYPGNEDMKEGDTFELIGNLAIQGCYDGDLEFIDARMDEEARVAREVARLQLPVRAKDNPAFATR